MSTERYIWKPGDFEIVSAPHVDFDDSEPRDESGKWAGGSGGAAPAAPKAPKPKWHKEGIDRHETETYGHEDIEHAHGAVHPEFNATRRQAGGATPNAWKAEAHGKQLGSFSGKKDAKKAVETAHQAVTAVATAEKVADVLKSAADKVDHPEVKAAAEKAAGHVTAAKANVMFGEHAKAQEHAHAAVHEHHKLQTHAEHKAHEEGEGEKGEGGGHGHMWLDLLRLLGLKAPGQ